MRAADLARHIDCLDRVTVAEYRAVLSDVAKGATLTETARHAAERDLAQRGVPQTLKEWNARQVALGALLAFCFDADHFDTLPVVARVYPTVAPREYAKAS